MFSHRCWVRLLVWVSWESSPTSIIRTKLDSVTWKPFQLDWGSRWYLGHQNVRRLLESGLGLMCIHMPYLPLINYMQHIHTSSQGKVKRDIFFNPWGQDWGLWGWECAPNVLMDTFVAFQTLTFTQVVTLFSSWELLLLLPPFFTLMNNFTPLSFKLIIV